MRITQQMEAVVEVENASDLSIRKLPYTFNYIIQEVNILCQEPILYDQVYKILKEGIKKWVNHQKFIENRSEGYSLLMSQIRVIRMFFDSFEKKIMATEKIKSIKELYLVELKKSITANDIDLLIQKLLNLVREFRESNGSTSIKQAHNITNILIDLDIYHNDFENILGGETNKYYKSKAEQLIANEYFNIQQYIDFMEYSLEKEKVISGTMLVKISHSKLVDIVYEQLIKNYHKKLLTKGLEKLVEDKSSKYIIHLYKYLIKLELLPDFFNSLNGVIIDFGVWIISKHSRVLPSADVVMQEEDKEEDEEGKEKDQETKEKVKEVRENLNIQSQGEIKVPSSISPLEENKVNVNIMSQDEIKSDETNKRQIIPELIQLRRKIRSIFKDLKLEWQDTKHKIEISNVEKTAFEKICESKDELIADQLAKQFGKYLNKHSIIENMSEEDIEKELQGDLIDMFKCNKSNDIFSSIYRSMLSTRLLFKESRNDRLEREIVEWFDKQCGKAYVKKMSKMLTEHFDDETGKTVKEELTPKTFEFNFKILDKSVWPINSQGFVPIPPQVTEFEDEFYVVYKEMFNHRKLSFNYSEATCVIKMNGLNTPLDIETNQVIGCLLLNYNHKEEIEDDEHLHFYLKALQREKIVNKVVKGEDEMNKIVYLLNPEFKGSSLHKITIFSTFEDKEKWDESDSVRAEMESVNDERKYQLKAIMAKVIKSFMRITYDDYFTKVQEKAWFTVKEHDFDSMIIELKSIGIIKEDPDTPKSYIYT